MFEMWSLRSGSTKDNRAVRPCRRLLSSWIRGCCCQAGVVR